MEAFEKDRELLRVALPTLLRTPRLEELVREVQTEELADSKEGFEFIQGFIEFVVKNEGVPDSNQRRDMLHEEAQKGTVVAVKVLLAATPVDATDNVGETALHKAAREGKTEVAKLLVDAKAALDAKNRSGHTPLHQAAWNGHLEVAKLLAPPAFTYSRLAHALAAEKNCHSKALEGLDLLHRVLPRLQNVPPLSDFMKHVQPKGIDDDRMLHFWHGYISQLINEKGEVDLSEVYFIQATDENGNNMLHLAAEQGHLEAVKFLLNAKAPVDAPAHFGETALRKAAREGKTEVASLLVVAKAALDAKNHSGETALHKAAREGKTEVAKLLVDAKAALDAKNRS